MHRHGGNSIGRGRETFLHSEENIDYREKTCSMHEGGSRALDRKKRRTNVFAFWGIENFRKRDKRTPKGVPWEKRRGMELKRGEHVFAPTAKETSQNRGIGRRKSLIC